MNSFPIKRFVFAVLLLLPLTFAIWYLTAPWHLAPITWLSNVLIQSLLPNAIQWLGLEGHTLVIASTVVATPDSQDALGFHLNPLVYSYSFPLLAALVLATPSSARWFKVLLGCLILVPFQLVAMLASVIKTLAFEIGQPFHQQYGFTPLGLDSLALVYQMSTLILPMILPLIIWGWLNREFLAELAPQLQTVMVAPKT